jgi:acetyl esterase/lipase
MRRLALLLPLCLALLGYAQAPPAQPPALPDWVSVESNIAYDQYKETVLDVLQPKAASKERRPGVIVIHGGGWTGGTKEAQAVPFCLRYLEKGFVCANVEYRLAKAALAPAAVTDEKVQRGPRPHRRHRRLGRRPSLPDGRAYTQVRQARPHG